MQGGLKKVVGCQAFFPMQRFNGVKLPDIWIIALEGMSGKVGGLNAQMLGYVELFLISECYVDG